MKILLVTIIALVFVGFSIQESFAEQIPSPRQQLEDGVSPDDIQCKENRVLVIRTNGDPACVTEKTADKKGWNIIAIEFAPKELIPTQRENYLNSLNFGLVSDEPFEGELYDFDQNLHLMQPAPAPMNLFFASNHYSLDENILVNKQNLNDIIPIPLTSQSVSANVIDYREWLPTYIASGYYLKWIDITQPEDQYREGDEDLGTIKFTFIPKGFEISEEITDKEFVDINMYVISVDVSDTIPLYMRSISEISEITKNGTTTDITYENKWNGHMKYVHESRSDPAKHGVVYHSPYVVIGSGGNALTMQEHENIVTELFERHSIELVRK